MKITFIPKNRKLSTILATSLLVLVISGALFHFWFINNTEQFIENIVATQSNGKVKLKVETVRFNYLNRYIRLMNASFISVDTADDPNRYYFEVSDLRLKIKSFRALLLRQEILLDSLNLVKPHVTIRHVRNTKQTKTDSTETDEGFSIAREMGNIYRSIEDALNILQIKYFRINEGRFTLVNALRPKQAPVNITDIFLEIDNIAINSDSSRRTRKVLFSDNIIVRSRNQRINFPGGRHQLSFGAFEMNVKNKRIEIEDCRVTGQRSDTSRASFNMYFNKLQLLDFDFAALTNRDLIKADSVYCQDPELTLSLTLREKNSKTRNEPFQLDEALRQLGTNMDIGFAGLSNADITVTTTRNNDPVSFNSKGNDFNLYGFRINNEAAKPIQLNGIDVAIRNYDMITRDGSTAIKFDSIQLRNNTIRLSNFSLHPAQNIAGKSIRHIDVPLLQITGLSWEELLLDRTIVAKKATLFNPRISYQKLSSQRGQQSFFNALAGIDELMEVDELELVNGNLKLLLKNQRHFELDNANFSIRSNQFMASQNIRNIERSIERFNFSSGIIKLGNIDIDLRGIAYQGDLKEMLAAMVIVKDSRNSSIATLNNVIISSLFVNEDLKIFTVDSLRWQQGNISIIPGITKGTNKMTGPDITIKNISGKQTAINAKHNQWQVQTFLQSITADEFQLKDGADPLLENLSFNGQNLAIQNNGLKISAGNYHISDQQPSAIDDLLFEKYEPNDSLRVHLSRLELTPSVMAMLQNRFYFDQVNLAAPQIYIRNTQKKGKGSKQNSLPPFHINKMVLLNPHIHYNYFTSNGNQQVFFKSSGQNAKPASLSLENLKADSGNLKASIVNGRTEHLVFTSANKRYGVDSGEVNFTLQNWQVDLANGFWQTNLHTLSLNNLLPLNLEQDAAVGVDSVTVQNVFASKQLTSIQDHLEASPKFLVTHFYGRHSNSTMYNNWFGLTYDHAKKQLSIDSFLHTPALTKTAFINAQTHQADYMDFKSGRINITGIDLGKWLTDSSLFAHKIAFTNPTINVFRNKLLPRKKTGERLLPVQQVIQWKTPLHIDSLSFTNARIGYAELDEKTKDTGSIRFTDFDVVIGPLKNQQLTFRDSLYITARAKLFDQGNMHLQLQQSYTDSLAGFKMQVQASLPDASILNQTIKPLTSVEITSGQLNSLWMLVEANSNVATGEMFMNYDDLRIRLHKPGEEDPGFKNNFKTFIANTFLVKSRNNASKPGMIFFERLKDRSIFNYMVKIFISGISTSIGIRSNGEADKAHKTYLKSKSNNNPASR